HPMSWSELRRFPQRACSLDYDSEMLIVAEDSNGDWVGVAFIQRQYRTKPASVSVEVTEAARDAGLGTLLEQHAAEILKGWNVSADGR
ncbi:MAG: hypothetical protein JWN70_2869, partial [Planctomycetaceae bacterium]|nr:hypothetical protein [Planctomycetaceae bacterium]